MPSPKRWFPLSRDINDDPEVWEFTTEFGERAIRILLEVLAIIDRTENEWRLTGHWLASLSRKVRQQPATVQRAICWMLAKGWLTAGQTSADGSPAILSTRNYWKFHKSREPKGSHRGSLPSEHSEHSEHSPPKPPQVDGAALARVEEFRKLYPERDRKKVGMEVAVEDFVKFNVEDQVQCIAATRAYAKYCRDNDRKPKDPNNFLRDQKGVEPWREFMPAHPTRPALKPLVPPTPTRSPEEIVEESGKGPVARQAIEIAQRNTSTTLTATTVASAVGRCK